ncbi:zinc finger BED domain-containing protein 5-like [Oratosquilla oratoria]|uniref:zinc finger BED domain-containing protein 5-like n=1 Tax=Oratosquilla oratoria TaxID=337810 RepID=UPI003F7651F7
MPKRKYDNKYLDYAFTFLEGRNEQLPQCVICHKTPSNDSMKSHQLKKHLSNVRPEFVGKERQFFELKANYLKKMRMDQDGKFQTESKAIVHASYAVSLLVATAKKPHSIGETLIKPCLVSCAGILLGESAVSKMKQVSLSNDTVKSRIFDMSCNTK